MNTRDSAHTNELPLWRLYALRAMYALLVFGLGSIIWPSILDLSVEWPLARSVVNAMLGALALLAVVGLRSPVQMLPLLLFELTWKTIWLLRVALPQTLEHRMDAATSATMSEVAWVGVLYLLLPWGYILQAYGARAGERWRRDPAAVTR
jgi:hypothetical protein